MNKKATLALVIAAPGALATMPLCSGGDDDFLPDISVSDDGATCKDMWEYYTNIFSTANPEMGKNKLTYNKCSASSGVAKEDDDLDFWLITDVTLAPTCCASGVSACDALVEPNMCAKSEDYQADMVIAVEDGEDDEKDDVEQNLVETCADINKMAAFTSAGFKYDLFKKNEKYNGPNGEKDKVMSRIFHWSKETCTNRDRESNFFNKKFGKILTYGAFFGCCGASGDDACYSDMGMLWQCRFDFIRFGTVSDACEEFYILQDDEVDIPETRRQLAKEGPVKVKTVVSGGPNTWSTTKARKMTKFKQEAKQFIRNLTEAKAKAKAAHARTVKKVAANKVGELEAARAAAKAAIEAHAVKTAGAVAAAHASASLNSKAPFRAIAEAKHDKAEKA